MSIQAKFTQFDETIRLKRFSESALLREKRDRVLNRLRAYLKANGLPTFQHLNQGSYEMGTGIKPLDGDFDIDVGVVFNIESQNYPAKVVKGWVYEAVADHTASVSWKEPCVTVTYARNFHVDLAVYAGRGAGLALARGKRHSADPSWQPADPKGLTAWVASRFAGAEADQFRRCVRMLKRWKDERFPSEGNAAPVGIGLTVAAGHWFRPCFEGRTPNDVLALEEFAARLLGQFRTDWTGKRHLAVAVPVVPRTDIFEAMTPDQTTQFYNRLERLHGTLREARALAQTNEWNAAERLAREFGSDFPR